MPEGFRESKAIGLGTEGTESFSDGCQGCRDVMGFGNRDVGPTRETQGPPGHPQSKAGGELHQGSGQRSTRVQGLSPV